MDLITTDLETYYDREYSLTKLTTEEYVRDLRFEIIGVGIKVNDQEAKWASGTEEELRDWLQSSFDWGNAMVLCHNTMFDGAILGWRLGIKPKVWADTLCMARALHGVEVGGSLAALAQRYALGEKGREVINALGKRRADFSDVELARYGDYCLGYDHGRERDGERVGAALDGGGCGERERWCGRRHGDGLGQRRHHLRQRRGRQHRRW